MLIYLFYSFSISYGFFGGEKTLLQTFHGIHIREILEGLAFTRTNKGAGGEKRKKRPDKRIFDIGKEPSASSNHYLIFLRGIHDSG